MYSVKSTWKSLALSPFSVFLLFPVNSAPSPGWDSSCALLLADGAGGVGLEKVQSTKIKPEQGSDEAFSEL